MEQGEDIERLEQHQMLTGQKVEQVLKRLDEQAPTVTPKPIFPQVVFGNLDDIYKSIILRRQRFC